MEPITGSGDLRAGSASIATARPPYTYFGVARSMMLSVTALASKQPVPVLAHALVSAHVLECLLKASITKGGAEEKVKQRDVRHNLKKLWAMAAAEGLGVPASPPNWVACLSAIHDSPYCLRYSTGVHGIVTPSVQLVTSELEGLLKEVEAHLK